MLRGIYAHKNKLNNTIFYVGVQAMENGRAHNFKQRSEHHRKYIEDIGEDNVEVLWLYKAKPDEDRKALSKYEVYYQNLYYNPEFQTKEYIIFGKDNPNYGNHWTDEMKQAMSEKRRRNGKSKGENNPQYGQTWAGRLGNDPNKIALTKKHMSEGRMGSKNGRATNCTVHSPDGKEYHFDILKDMDDWLRETFHVCASDTNRLGLNKPKEYFRTHSFKGVLDGWYYTKD